MSRVSYIDPSGYNSYGEMNLALKIQLILTDITTLKINMYCWYIRLGEASIGGKILKEVIDESFELLLEGDVDIYSIMWTGVEVVYGLADSEQEFSTLKKTNKSSSNSRNRIGNPVNPMDKTYEMALNPELYANEVAKKYGINLKGSGQKISILYNPELASAGKTRAVKPNVIELGTSAFVSEEELANTIAHELNHARSFLKGGDAPEWGKGGAYPAGNALTEYIRGER